MSINACPGMLPLEVGCTPLDPSWETAGSSKSTQKSTRKKSRKSGPRDPKMEPKMHQKCNKNTKTGYGIQVQKKHQKSTETDPPRPSKTMVSQCRGCKNQEIQGSPKSAQNVSNKTRSQQMSKIELKTQKNTSGKGLRNRPEKI